MRCWVRVIPFLRAPMPLNPNATPFVRASTCAVASAAGAASNARGDDKGQSLPKIYCDLDGCLADFDKGCQSVMGEAPDKLSKKVMWRGLAQAKGFYEHLDWMEDGRQLWNGVSDLRPTILTGLPMGSWAEPQKAGPHYELHPKKWCQRELGEDVPVITCMSRDKHLYCRRGNVLIDDRASLAEAWERAGGVFIHHTSATSSLAKLKTLLPAQAEDSETDSQGSSKRRKNG
ncbi:unnamed protein product [Scytosiphon promiscuus]